MEKFIVGKENKEAAYWAERIIEEPGLWGSPLILISEESGTGKTQLVKWIVSSLEEKHGMRVKMTTGEDLAEQMIPFIAGRQRKLNEEMVRELKEYDVLAVEHMECLAGKCMTQRILHQVFRTLIKEGKQLILTGKTRPDEAKYVRAVRDFYYLKGVCVTMKRPGNRLRREIARQKSEKEGMYLEENMLRLIANHAINGWQIEGVICQLKAHRKIEKREIDSALVLQALNEKGLVS